MLFRALDTYLVETPPKKLIKLSQYIDTINTKRSLTETRYEVSEGLDTPAIEILKNIIFNADINNLLRMDSDSTRYINSLIDLNDNLDDIFDQNSTGKNYINVFIKSMAKPCKEYLVPIHRANYLTQLPIDGSWDEWSKVRSVRLLDIDSLELTFHTYTDKIVFKFDQPSTAVIGIDTVALVLQYVNYLKNNPTDKLPLQLYLHRYVLRGFLIDLENLWLRNKYLDLIQNKDGRSIISENHFYGFQGSQYHQAVMEVFHLIENCEHRNVTPQTLLSSLELAESTVPHYLKHLLAVSEIHNLKQYYWLIFLRDLKWLDLLYSTYALQENSLLLKNLLRSLRRDLPILNNTKFWNNCHDSGTRDYIERNMIHLMSRVMG